MNFAQGSTMAGWIGMSAGASIRCWIAPTATYIAKSMIARIVIVAGGVGKHPLRIDRICGFILCETDPYKSANPVYFFVSQFFARCDRLHGLDLKR
jgi:hypothetical protein